MSTVLMFGMRFDLRNPPMSGVAMADRYRAMLDMCEWADEHGGLIVGLSEHHGSDDGYLPSPLVMAAAVAARTSNVRIMIAAIIAPFHDPLRLAEDCAVVDQISGGRLDVTIGAGYVPSEFEMFGVERARRVRSVEETVATLKQAWTGTPFEFRGRTVCVQPPPCQPGGPTITLGGSSDAAARRAARIADAFQPSDQKYWEPYRQACIELGRPDPGPSLGALGTSVVQLADDPESAWAEYGPYSLHETNAYGAWQLESGVDNTYRVNESVDTLRESDQYRILTPADYGAELAAAPIPFAMLHPMVGGTPPDLAWKSLRHFESLLD